MRIFALELNNDIKGIAERKAYIEALFGKLDRPDFVMFHQSLPSKKSARCTILTPLIFPVASSSSVTTYLE